MHGGEKAMDASLSLRGVTQYWSVVEVGLRIRQGLEPGSAHYTHTHTHRDTAIRAALAHVAEFEASLDISLIPFKCIRSFSSSFLVRLCS